MTNLVFCCLTLTVGIGLLIALLLLLLSLGRVALVRGVSAYGYQTFPWTIYRSVRRSVQCIVENGGSDPDAI